MKSASFVSWLEESFFERFGVVPALVVLWLAFGLLSAWTGRAPWQGACTQCPRRVRSRRDDGR